MRDTGDRGTLDEGRRGEVFRHIRSVEKEYSGGGANMGRRRPKPKSVNRDAVPSRGELDDDGNVFLGFEGDQLKEEVLDYTHFKKPAQPNQDPWRLPTRVKVHLDSDTDGTVPAGKLPSGTKIGQIKARPSGTPDDMDWGGQGSVPKTALPALSDSDIGGMGKYLTAVPAGYITKNELENILKDYRKK